MANTTFSGPVTSTNGFIGTITGGVIGPVVATTLSASGAVILSGLPTSDPTVAGQLWNNLGVLNVSAG
jgi:hypothetical protein